MIVHCCVLAPPPDAEAASPTSKQVIWVPIFDNMAPHMKTTLDIAGPLMEEAKAIAHRDGTTLRALVERGLQLALSERRSRRKFKLRDGSVDGTGLHTEAAGHSWDELRDRSYEGRGS